MPSTLTDLKWVTRRHPASVRGPQGIASRRAYVSPTDYLTVKREYGEWTWTVHTYRAHDLIGNALQRATGSESTMEVAKTAAYLAWLGLETGEKLA